MSEFLHRCKYCNEGFVTEKARQNHELKIHVQMNSEVKNDNGTSEVYHCLHCSKGYSNQVAVEQHEKYCRKKLRM